MKKTSDLFIHCLEAHGITHIFGVPGEENLDLIESIRNSSIQLTVTRNEQSAVFMAATYGRLTGKAGVAIATLGPGATNMMTGVAYAQLGGMPVLVITGQKPIKKSKQGKFQIIDVVGMMKPITKFSKSIVSGSKVPSTISYALQAAESEKPGAVHIELPEDIAGEQVEKSSTPFSYEKMRRPIAEERSIDAIIYHLEKSKNPLVLVGAGANRKRISKYLTEFITKNNIPFFCSQMGKGVIDERLPQYIGTAALTSNDYIHKIIDNSDLILAIGHDTIEKPTNIIETRKTRLIHISFTPAEFDELYKPTLQVIGDIGNTFRQLCQKDIDKSTWNVHETIQKGQGIIAKINENAYKHHQSVIMMPGRIIHEIRSILKEEDIVALDNGLYKVRFARNYLSYKPNTLLLDNALATMGAGYCSALIAKMINPEKTVITVTGDGGFVMNLGDLATVVGSGLDLIIIIVNDNAYGMIKWKQINHNYKEFGLDLQNPDFVKLAESFGAIGTRVDKPQNFTKILQNAIKDGGVQVLEVPFQYPKEIK